MKYVKQLDGIRGIAVILVVVSHWIPKSNVWKWGEMGVDIFFVLSGFLITGILLENRRAVEELSIERSQVLKNFFARRVLRIFPLYYTVILIHYILDDLPGVSIRDSLFFHLTYTSNIYFWINSRIPSLFTHLWSLSVEEQFYLVWPWVILFVPRLKIVHVIWGFIVFGIIFSFVIPGRIDKLTPACFGAFGLGALLAYVQHENMTLSRNQLKWSNWLTLFSVVLLILYPLYHKVINPYSITRLLISIVALRTIYYCMRENDVLFINSVLNNGSLVFIGKISYGIYLIHTLIPFLWESIVALVAKLNIVLNVHPALAMVLQFGMTILISWWSWLFLESPFLRLKKYFNYGTTR